MRALITSTPVVGATVDPVAPDHDTTPDPGTGLSTVAHAAAGPWSTLPGAPASTPTLLRSAWQSPSGGATATATGRSATVTNGVPAVTARAATPAAPAPVRPPRDLIPAPAPPRGAPADPPAPDRPPPAGALLDSAPLLEAALPERARPTRPTMTVFQVASTMIVALLLWALVDAPSLLHGAETSPRGTRRDAALALLRPLDRVSAALGLDRVTHLTDDLLGRHHAAPPAAAAVPRASAHRTGPVPGPAVTAPPTPTAVSRLPALRIGTAANPLRVLVVGDSLGLSFGYSVANKLGASGIIKATVDAREATGLTRPDAFDWGAQLQADLAQFHPEIVVAMFGGNDDQDAIVNGRFITFGTRAWGEIYGARVASFADHVHASGARLLWAGLPVMRSATKSNRVQTVMAVTRAVLAGRDGAAFVDDRTALADGSGHYAVALPDASGQVVIVREPDGVHLTPAGADRLADRAIATMQSIWQLALHPAPAAAPGRPAAPLTSPR